MIRLAIFDLDGTLLDTREGMCRCGTAALCACGLPAFPKERYGAFSGGGVEDFVKGILKAAGDTDYCCYNAFCERYLEEEARVVSGDYRPFDGMPEVLAELRRRGVWLAVLSNKGHASCVEILKETFEKGAFDLIRGNLPGIPPKPDPAGAGEILKAFGVRPEEAVYVGDTEVDMQTGKNAGLFTAAALWGYRPRAALETFGPDCFAGEPKDLLRLF